MSTVANVVLPKEKKVRVKKAEVPAPEKVASPKKVATPKPATPASESEAEEKPEKEVKPRKPTLSAKYTKFVVFGYSMVNALVAAGLIPEDQVDTAYAQIKLMDSVEDQTAFYSGFLENLSASGKAMKKFLNDKKKPPKEPKVRKPRAKKADSDAEPKAPKEKKPRAKKEAKAESESESEPKKEKKPKAKKSVTVESDANVDLISNLVNAAQADPIPAPVDAPAEAPKAKKEPKVKESKAKEPKATKEPKAKAKKEAPAAPVVEPTPALEAEDDDDDEVIQTRETVIDGETFLVDQEGNLYDPETHEFVRKL